MKKYILSLVALLTLVSGFAYATQDEPGGPNTKREIAGTLGYVPFKEYQLVRWGENGPNAATGGNLSQGDVVVWDCVSDDGVTIALVGATNSVDAVAGVVVSTNIQSADTVGTTPGIDYGRRNWGYIQVRGFTNKLNVVGGPASAGGALRASETARNATAATTVVTTATTGGTQRVMGFAYDASETGVGNKAQIDL